MKIDRTVKLFLITVALFTGVIALRPYVTPPVVEAQSGEAHPVYIEPGVAMLRAPDGSQQVMGKVVIDLRNGNIWGFPTLSQDPYPSAGANVKPPTVHPFLLGKLAFGDMDR